MTPPDGSKHRYTELRLMLEEHQQRRQSSPEQQWRQALHVSQNDMLAMKVENPSASRTSDVTLVQIMTTVIPLPERLAYHFNHVDGFYLHICSSVLSQIRISKSLDGNT